VKLRNAFVAVLLLSCLAMGQSFTQGTMQSSGTTCVGGNTPGANFGNDCVSTSIAPPVGAIAVVLEGTWAATVQFEGSADGGTTWVSVNATPVPSGAAVTSTTASGTWTVSVVGLSYFRVRASAYSSGTVQVSLNSAIGAVGSGGAISGAVTVTGGPVSTTGPTAGGNAFANPSATPSSQLVAMSTTAAVQIVALSAGKSVYLVSGYFYAGTGTTPTFSLEYGTGTNCGTGTTVFYPATAIPTSGSTALPTDFFVVPAGNAVCYLLGGTTPTGTLALTTIQQ
jgi:hypothetical protein